MSTAIFCPLLNSRTSLQKGKNVSNRWKGKLSSGSGSNRMKTKSFGKGSSEGFYRIPLPMPEVQNTHLILLPSITTLRHPFGKILIVVWDAEMKGEELICQLSVITGQQTELFQVSKASVFGLHNLKTVKWHCTQLRRPSTNICSTPTSRCNGSKT